MKEFYLIRHAESLGNIGMDDKHDPDLSPLGYVQAGQCAEFMKRHLNGPAIVLASPFKRCLRTAEIIAKFNKIGVVLEPSLHEYFKAEWFPVKKVKFASLREIAASSETVKDKNYPDGRWWPDKNEVEADVKMRMALFRNRLLGGRYPQDRIVCVGHLTSIIFLAEAMCKGIVMESVRNAGVTKIVYDKGSFMPVFVNNTDFQKSVQGGAKA